VTGLAPRNAPIATRQGSINRIILICVGIIMLANPPEAHCKVKTSLSVFV
jgi:hypothetical protein